MIHNPNFVGRRNANIILKSFQQDTQILPSLDELRKGNDEEDELEKGGEGSKGGKVIGHTQSGKAIYEEHTHHPAYTEADHYDAYKHHLGLANKERQKSSDSYEDKKRIREHEKASKYHYNKAGYDEEDE